MIRMSIENGNRPPQTPLEAHQQVNAPELQALNASEAAIYQSETMTTEEKQAARLEIVNRRAAVQKHIQNIGGAYDMVHARTAADAATNERNIRLVGAERAKDIAVFREAVIEGQKKVQELSARLKIMRDELNAMPGNEHGTERYEKADAAVRQVDEQLRQLRIEVEEVRSRHGEMTEGLDSSDKYEQTRSLNKRRNSDM